MCTRADCHRYMGKYIRFQTPYGYHEGIIERVDGNRAIVLSPRQYIPKHVSAELLTAEEQKDLDIQLAWGFGGRPGIGYGAPGAGYGYGYYGWGRWAVSFLAIYALFGLFW